MRGYKNEGDMMQKTVQKYYSKYFSEDKAQQYGEVLERINEKHNGITPKDVVNEARRKTSPLHDFFLWDDKLAAEKHRMQQARWLINVITIDGNGDKKYAYENVVVVDAGGDAERRYKPVYEVLSDEEYRKQMVQQAYKYLIYWEQKYRIFHEFAPVVKAIETVKRRVIRHGKERISKSGTARPDTQDGQDKDTGNKQPIGS